MMPRRTADGALEGLEAQGECILSFPCQKDQRAEKVVPRGHKLEKGHGEKGGFGQRKNDLAENPEFPASIDSGGFGEIPRNREKELAKEEHIEGSGQKCGDPQWLESSNPTQRTEKTVDRNHDHGKGNHHGRQQNEKTGIPPPPVQSGKTIGHPGTGQNGADDIQNSQEKTIAGIQPERAHRFHGVRIVVPLGGEWNPLRGETHCLDEGFERGGDHPKKRQNEKQAQHWQSQPRPPTHAGTGMLHPSTAPVVNFLFPQANGEDAQAEDQEKEAEGQGGGIAHIPKIKGILINVGG